MKVKGALVVASLCAVLLVGATRLSCADCSNPPTGFGNAWWANYAAWCSRCGGTPNKSSMSCTPGPNWGGRAGSGTPGIGTTGSLEVMVMESFIDNIAAPLLESLVTSILNSGERRAALARQRALQRARERQRQQQRQQERELQRELERQQFEEAKRKTCEEMKGTNACNPEELKPKGTKFFGVGGTSVLSLKPIQMAQARPVEGSWAQLHCSSYLSQRAAAAAARGNEDETNYLSDQAARAMTGGPIGVSCPPPPPLAAQMDPRELETQIRDLQPVAQFLNRLNIGLAQAEWAVEEKQGAWEEAEAEFEWVGEQVETAIAELAEPYLVPDPELEARSKDAIEYFDENAVVVNLKERWETKQTLTVAALPPPTIPEGPVKRIQTHRKAKADELKSNLAERIDRDKLSTWGVAARGKARDYLFDKVDSAVDSGLEIRLPVVARVKRFAQTYTGVVNATWEETQEVLSRAPRMLAYGSSSELQALESRAFRAPCKTWVALGHDVPCE